VRVVGGGYQDADLDVFFEQMGLPRPSVTFFSVDGTPNAPGSEADGEVVLDIEVDRCWTRSTLCSRRRPTSAARCWSRPATTARPTV